MRARMLVAHGACFIVSRKAAEGNVIYL